MPKPNIIVDRVLSVAAPTSRNRMLAEVPSKPTVQFQGGDTVHLDASNDKTRFFADILEEMRQNGLTVYVESDPVTHVVTDLRIPLIVKVVKLGDSVSGDTDVELEISHARHVLRRKNPDFDALSGILQAALAQHNFVAITENDDQEIIDVRTAPGPFPDLNKPITEESDSHHLSPDLIARAMPTAVTPQRAMELFNLVNSRSCDPLAVPPPCIPFAFPDDGCWGRAHEMSRVMIADGAVPGKIWIYGNLRVNTRNKPNCVQTWVWHVAPVLQVLVGGATQVHVIDPSMFGSPVRDVTWEGAQHDPNATIAFTDASAFYRSPTGQISLDPTYSETANVLAQFRAQLRLRSMSVGAPPYANCVEIA